MLEFIVIIIIKLKFEIKGDKYKHGIKKKKS